ncbi:MAG: hypothetical protein H7Y04_12035 [Verrucomicrobia bacterium]|nr:hypothetical protein [Cytophagales bacterium]
MAISKKELREDVENHVKRAFQSKEDIFFTMVHMDYFDEKINKEWLKQVIEETYMAKLKEEEEWEEKTDFDKLAEAFDELSTLGIITLHTAGADVNDGDETVLEVYESLGVYQYKAIGCCFYHHQDLDRLIHGGNVLFLAFGDLHYDEEKNLVIGHKIVEVLNRKGLYTEWNQKRNARIQIVNFSWQKRFDTEDWGRNRTAKFLTKD